MRQLRERGVYLLNGIEFVAVKRTTEIFFLFSRENWELRGPVDYRLSHGKIFKHGELTTWGPDDLFDTGQTADSPAGKL